MTAAKTKKAKPVEAIAEAPSEVIVSIKGFDANLACRGFQFEIGKSYEHAGKVVVCKSGFHACENPLDVFGYYPPGPSRYAIVTQNGKLARHDNDTKIASARITIDAELKLPDVIARAVKWVIDHATAEEGGKHVEGDQSAASSTGSRSAASSTGDQSAASSTGSQSAASSTGYQSAASSTGYRSAASSTGDQSAAMSSGENGRVRGVKGCALFLVYRNPRTLDIEHAWAGIVGRDGIEPLIWYTLNSDGKPEVAP